MLGILIVCVCLIFKYLVIWLISVYFHRDAMSDIHNSLALSELPGFRTRRTIRLYSLSEPVTCCFDRCQLMNLATLCRLHWNMIKNIRATVLPRVTCTRVRFGWSLEVRDHFTLAKTEHSCVFYHNVEF